MTQIEFTNRTNVQVTSSEFEAINEVYMNCDLDKDDFCKMWMKMNKSRVEKAIAAEKAARMVEKQRETAFNIYCKLNTLPFEASTKLAVNVLTDKEETFCEGIGIKMQEWSSWYGCNIFRQTISVSYDLGVYCGAIRA